MSGAPAEPVSGALDEPYQQGLRRGEIWLQRCAACGRHQHYPRTGCRHCGSTDIGFVRASGQGVVYALSVVHRPPDPEHGTAPYVLALVELDEGPRLLTQLVGAGRDRAAIGDAVQLTAGRLTPDGPLVPLARTR